MNLAHVWVYLETTPLLGLACTLVAWQAAVALSGRLGNAAAANPVLLATALLVAPLLATGTSYAAYFQDAQSRAFPARPRDRGAGGADARQPGADQALRAGAARGLGDGGGERDARGARAGR